MRTPDSLQESKVRSVLDGIDPSIKRRLKRIFLLILIVLIGYSCHKLLVWMRYVPPKAQVIKTAALVSTYPLKQTVEYAHVIGYGTVEPSRELEVRAQVSGHVTALSDGFEVGARVAEGEVIIAIDPRDYQIEIESEKAQLARAEFELELERGNQVVAKREWELLSDDVDSGELGESLALRKPHLREKQAALEAARNRLKKAQLNLERTKITTPFDGAVLEENVEVGKYITSQSTVARLAATDEFYIKVRISRSALRWLNLEDENGLQKHSVTVFEGQGAEDPQTGWNARMLRLLSDVDPQGRMARVLVAVSRPLDPQVGRSPLLLGSFVKAEITGRELTDVFSVPRTAVREGDILWIVGATGLLELVPVEIVQSRGEVTLVRGALVDGQSMVTSPLPGALEGMAVKVAGSEVQ